MPVPLIILGCLAIVSAVGGLTYCYWDDVLAYWGGKQLAVLGAPGVGKTYLLEFLQTGSIPALYQQTLSAKKVAAKRINLKDLSLTLKETCDVGGTVDAHKDWKKLCAEADIVFYLFRADYLIINKDGTKERMLRDVKFLKEAFEERGEKHPDFFIIGTHCDLDPKFPGNSSEKFGSYRDEFHKCSPIDEIIRAAGGGGKLTFDLGSMKTTQDTEGFVVRLLGELKK